jgi:hypothetical protein
MIKMKARKKNTGNILATGSRKYNQTEATGLETHGPRTEALRLKTMIRDHNEDRVSCKGGM